MLNSSLKWIGCICAIIGALLVTLNIEPWNIVFANLGSLFYLLWAIRIKEWNIILVNLVFILIYGYGVIIRL
jgi:hypothetical protein